MSAKSMRECWESWRDRLYDGTDDPRVAIRRAFMLGYVNGTREAMNALSEWRSDESLEIERED